MMLSRLVVQKNKKSNMPKIVAFGFIALNALLLQPSPTLAQNSQGSEISNRDLGNPQLFVGTWTGDGYQCPFGISYAEKVEIKVIGNSLVATKITGDDCVRAGQQTFSGEIPDQILKGSFFPITFTTGTPEAPGSSTTLSELIVVDANTFITGGCNTERIVFTRDK